MANTVVIDSGQLAEMVKGFEDRIAELRVAAEPFAEWAEWYVAAYINPHEPDERTMQALTGAGHWRSVSVGDLRRLAEAMGKEDG